MNNLNKWGKKNLEIIVLVILIAIPIILFFLSRDSDVNISTWIGFWGSYAGSIAILVGIYGLKESRDATRRQHELDKLDKERELLYSLCKKDWIERNISDFEKGLTKLESGETNKVDDYIKRLNDKNGIPLYKIKRNGKVDEFNVAFKSFVSLEDEFYVGYDKYNLKLYNKIGKDTSKFNLKFENTMVCEVYNEYKHNVELEKFIEIQRDTYKLLNHIRRIILQLAWNMNYMADKLPIKEDNFTYLRKAKTHKKNRKYLETQDKYIVKLWNLVNEHLFIQVNNYIEEKEELIINNQINKLEKNGMNKEFFTKMQMIYHDIDEHEKAFISNCDKSLKYQDTLPEEYHLPKEFWKNPKENIYLNK